MNIIKLQQRGTLTLPMKIRKSLNLEEGSVLRISERNDQIVLEKVDSSESDLLRDIKHSLADIKQGNFIEFRSISEFKKKLKNYDTN